MATGHGRRARRPAACPGRGAGRLRGAPAEPAGPLRAHRARLRHRRRRRCWTTWPAAAASGPTTSTWPRCAAGWRRGAPAGTAGPRPPGTRPRRARFTAWLRRAGADRRGRRSAAGQPEGAPHAARRARARPGAGRRRVRRRRRGADRSARRRRPRAAVRQRHPRRASSSASTSTTSTAGRRLLRVLGKGRKERSVPYGVPAERRARRLADPRPTRRWPTPTRARRCCSAPAGRRLDPREARRTVHAAVAARAGRPGHRPARAAALAPRRTCSRAARTSGPSRSCSATLASRRRRSTRT